MKLVLKRYWADGENSWIRPLAFVVSLLVMYFRAPAFFFEPRLWAEEGTRYFAYAYGHTWLEALLNVQRGYFALWPNIASTLAAKCVPLDSAPLVTTLFAFAVQLVPIAMILWGQSELWQSMASRLLAVAVVVFAPNSGEVWLNTINSQFYFSLIAFLLLNEPIAATPATRWYQRILLVMAGLTGAVSCLLLPLFVWRAWSDRNRERFLQAAMLAVCLGLQVVALAGDASVPVRFAGIDLPTFAAIFWTQSIASIFLGRLPAGASALFIQIGYSQPDWRGWIGGGLLVVDVLFLGLIFYPLGRSTRWRLAGGYCLLMFFSVVGALASDKALMIDPRTGPRYFYVPNIILMLGLLSNSRLDSGWLKSNSSKLFSLLLVAALLLGAVQYQAVLYRSEDWPKWRDEVKIWQTNPDYAIRIWPPNWQIQLKKHP